MDFLRVWSKFLIAGTICLVLVDGRLFSRARSKRGLNAKRYDGFQELEAALIPLGSYIQLTDIPLQQASTARPVASLDETTLNGLINSIIGGQIGQDGAARKRSEANRRWLAGIIPLRAAQLPMGIFIPESTALGGRAGGSPAVRSKITNSVRRIFTRLRKLALRREAFDYSRAFNGLSPLEAVLIPRGYFVPLSSLAGHGANAGHFVAGIEPLDTVTLQGGIFIPYRMSALPELPAHVIAPPNRTTARPSGGVVSTPRPDDDEISLIPPTPNFPEPAVPPFPSMTSVPGRPSAPPGRPTMVVVPVAASTTPSPSSAVTGGAASSTAQLASQPIVQAPAVGNTGTSVTPSPSLATTRTTAAATAGNNGAVTFPPPPWLITDAPTSRTRPTTSARPGPVRPVRPGQAVNFSIFLPANTPIKGHPALVHIHRDNDEVIS